MRSLTIEKKTFAVRPSTKFYNSFIYGEEDIISPCKLKLTSSFKLKGKKKDNISLNLLFSDQKEEQNYNFFLTLYWLKKANSAVLNFS